MLVSESPSPIQVCFLERTRKGQEREGNEGAREEVGRKWRCHRLGRREAGGNGGQAAARELCPPCSCFSQATTSPSPALGGEAQARLGNLSVLSEMSAEINLANPPQWPVTLISLKFRAD